MRDYNLYQLFTKYDSWTLYFIKDILKYVFGTPVVGKRPCTVDKV